MRLLSLFALSPCCAVARRFSFFFFTHPATTEIYTLSLHDALPISRALAASPRGQSGGGAVAVLEVRLRVDARRAQRRRDRKSTRLNSSHTAISYAVFCLKKKRCSSLSARASARITTSLIPPPHDCS